MAGGCTDATSGMVCWGAWWLPLVGLAIFLVIAGVIVAGVVSIVRNPRDAFLYYRSKRNLVVLPLTHPALWALLLGAGVPAIVLAIGLRAIRR